MHDFAAVLPRARPDIDDPISRTDGVFVVFHDDQRVAETLQLHQGLDESAIVALMQTDAGLVEHIKHAGQPGPDLGSEADSLRLTPAQRSRRPGEIEVTEPHLDEKLEASANLAQHGGRDVRLTLGERECLHELEGVDEAELRDRRDAVPMHSNGEHFRTQPIALADGARDLPQVAGVPLTRGIRLRLEELSLDVGHDALEAGGILHLAAVTVFPLDGDLEIVAPEDGLGHLVVEVFPGGFQREVEVAGEPLK